MTAKILDGKAIAKAARATLKADVNKRIASGERPPGLAVILVGNDPASEIYVKGKRRDCEEVGFHSNFQHLSSNITQEDLEERVEALNADSSIDGILVQSPLPDHIDEDRIIDRIDPLKDVDGFHPYNIGRLALRRPSIRSCTPMGIMQLLEHTGAKTADAHVVLDRHDELVRGCPLGKPRIHRLHPPCQALARHRVKCSPRERPASWTPLWPWSRRYPKSHWRRNHTDRCCRSHSTTEAGTFWDQPARRTRRR